MRYAAWALLFLLSIPVSPAAASWLINEKKFHISAHGLMGCTECHDQTAARQDHPDPALVSRPLSSFFDSEHCLDCHDWITADLELGTHGGRRIQDREEFLYCIGCHDPHYQLRLGENRMGDFDLRKPRHEQCGACHEEKRALPALSGEDESCMGCHRRADKTDPGRAESTSRFCLYCHGQAGEWVQVLRAMGISLIKEPSYNETVHSDIVCTICHPDSADFGHDEQESADCLQCHVRHHEKVTHDAHMNVACEACHLGGVGPVRDPATGKVVWNTEQKTGAALSVHEMVDDSGEESCTRCHYSGNPVGAASMVLPAKGILCMPCHAATFSVGDTVTLISMAIFMIGLFAAFSFWLTGSLPGETREASPFHNLVGILRRSLGVVLSRRIWTVIRTLIMDVLLQRRLYRQSFQRWFIHSLIFLPFVFRFAWGLAALLLSLWRPGWSWIWPMLDRNHPLTAFLFDFTGVMVLLGVVLAVIRVARSRPERPSGLPEQDRWALGLIAGIVIVGFVLEGMRMAMTDLPEGSVYAFGGYLISLIFSEDSGLTEMYGYVWYAHAVLTGAFIAYLPFSRMFHILTAPVILIINRVNGREP